MITIRGVNVFPSAIENLIRTCQEVDEFRVRAGKRGELDELSIEVELIEGANADAVPAAIAQSISSTIGFRPTVTTVPRGTLPRFELKAKRFHYFGS
jgi:phenylacetate-CoA ligase